MVGAHTLEYLQSAEKFEIFHDSRESLNLTRSDEVFSRLSAVKPDIVIVAAAKVGGIRANSENRAAFLLENLNIQNSLLQASQELEIENLVFLGSSCIYPKNAKQPISEDDLLTGALEPTNEGYALAKISGHKFVEYIREDEGRNWYSLMPSNLYGPKDNFDPNSSHVIPGIMGKFHTAKKQKAESVELWGTGAPLREFVHADDLGRIIVETLDKVVEHSLINIGSEAEVSISELAEAVRDVVGFEGRIVFNSDFPDGTMRKKLDLTRMNELGLKTHIDLPNGLASTYQEVFGD